MAFWWGMDGTVVTWGHDQCGGDSSGVQQWLHDVEVGLNTLLKMCCARALMISVQVFVQVLWLVHGQFFCPEGSFLILRVLHVQISKT